MYDVRVDRSNIIRVEPRHAEPVRHSTGRYPVAPKRPNGTNSKFLTGSQTAERVMTQNIRDIMSRQPIVAHVDHSLAEVAKRMRDADTGAMPVVDGDELVGVVTDRDLVVRGIAERADPAMTSVLDAMTRHVVFCHENAPIEEAASPMAHERVRRLAVVDRACELVGMVSLADIARADNGGRNIAAAAMRSISEPMNAAKTPAGEDLTGGRARGSSR